MENILYCYLAKEISSESHGTDETGQQNMEQAKGCLVSGLQDHFVIICHDYVADYPVYYIGIRLPSDYDSYARSHKLMWLRAVGCEASKAVRHMIRLKHQGIMNQGKKNHEVKNREAKNHETKNREAKNHVTKNHVTKNHVAQNQIAQNQGTMPPLSEDECYLTYHPRFEDWLRKQGCLGWWKASFGVEEFGEGKSDVGELGKSGFVEAKNLPVCLEHIPEWKNMKQVIVLGCPREMISFLPMLATNVASMEVYVREEEDLPEQLEEISEAILEEYGLCPRIIRWKKKALESEYPTLVVDFLPDRISASGLAKGSIWVDMTSSTSKQYFLSEEKGNVTYFSLKRIWWKEMEQTLDTIGKTQYNTQVKRV